MSGDDNPERQADRPKIPTEPVLAEAARNGAAPSKSTVSRADVIATIALVVAVGAFANSVWQNVNQSRHQRLTVIPVLSATFVDQNDPDFYGILIENTGTGPARVTNARLYVDGKLQGPATDLTWNKVLSELGIPNSQDIATTSFFGNASIQSGRSVRIFGAFHKNLTPELKPKIFAGRQRLQFSICYCALYGDCFPYNSPGLHASPCPA